MHVPLAHVNGYFDALLSDFRSLGTTIFGFVSFNFPCRSWVSVFSSIGYFFGLFSFWLFRAVLGPCPIFVFGLRRVFLVPVPFPVVPFGVWGCRAFPFFHFCRGLSLGATSKRCHAEWLLHFFGICMGIHFTFRQHNNIQFGVKTINVFGLCMGIRFIFRRHNNIPFGVKTMNINATNDITSKFLVSLSIMFVHVFRYRHVFRIWPFLVFIQWFYLRQKPRDGFLIVPMPRFSSINCGSQFLSPKKTSLATNVDVITSTCVNARRRTTYADVRVRTSR